MFWVSRLGSSFLNSPTFLGKLYLTCSMYLPCGIHSLENAVFLPGTYSVYFIFSISSSIFSNSSRYYAVTIVGKMTGSKETNNVLGRTNDEKALGDRITGPSTLSRDCLEKLCCQSVAKLASWNTKKSSERQATEPPPPILYYIGGGDRTLTTISMST